MLVAANSVFDYGALTPTGAGTDMTASRDPSQSLDRFIREAGRRARVIAEMAVRDREAAMDIVQDSLMALVSRYADRPHDEWAPLLHTILQSRIMDWRRREARRGKWFSWLRPADPEQEEDPLENIPGRVEDEPLDRLERAGRIEDIRQALEELPERQRQAFLLRAWEGFDTITTASIMGCSDGSVKTHYARALQALRARLADESGGEAP